MIALLLLAQLAADAGTAVQASGAAVAQPAGLSPQRLAQIQEALQHGGHQ